MPALHRLFPSRAALQRLLAGGCAGLILALTCFAASPAAHDWVHAIESSGTCTDGKHAAPAPQPTDDGCAIVLFAGGVDLPVGPLALVPPESIDGGVSPVTAEEFYWVSPRYLHQPERGPPVG